MLADPDVNPWTASGPRTFRGGPVVVDRVTAPLGRVLPYRRASGEHPTSTGLAEEVARKGWSVSFSQAGLGDMLLGLGLVQAMVDATNAEGLSYTGPRADLMRRCLLPLTVSQAEGEHLVRGGAGTVEAFRAFPERPPTWLDPADESHVNVHAALPMRYYLEAEQALGIRLPADYAPVPGFRSHTTATPGHVVFVAATSWKGRKDYGHDGFERVAQMLTSRHPARWAFTVVAGRDEPPSRAGSLAVLSGLDDVDCLDVFGSAEVVIGNDTGLTHLAALTRRPDGSGPHVIGLYGRHAYGKWTTGHERHHAIATPFSQMLHAADRCPVRDSLDDATWGAAANLAMLPPDLIASFTAQVAGWD